MFTENRYSVDNPYLYNIFGREIDPNIKLGNEDPIGILTHKKRPGNVCVYGRSLHTFTFIQGLLARNIPAERIILLIPPPSYENKMSFNTNQEKIEYEDLKLTDEEAFEDETVRDIVLSKLKDLGIDVRDGFDIKDKSSDSDLNKSQNTFIELQTTGRHQVAQFIDSKVFVARSQVDINMDLFNTIQNNGLVYNGRLIVKNNFQTTDDDIFACGELVEFSQRYKNYALGRSLRLDKYSGRELGQKLAMSILEYMGVLSGTDANDPEYQELPVFQMPIGIGGYLPEGLIYYRVNSVLEGVPDEMVIKN